MSQPIITIDAAFAEYTARLSRAVQPGDADAFLRAFEGADPALVAQAVAEVARESGFMSLARVEWRYGLMVETARAEARKAADAEARVAARPVASEADAAYPTRKDGTAMDFLSAIAFMVVRDGVDAGRAVGRRYVKAGFCMPFDAKALIDAARRSGADATARERNVHVEEALRDLERQIGPWANCLATEYVKARRADEQPERNRAGSEA